MNSTARKIMSVILCIAMALSFAVSLCVNVSSETTAGEGSSETEGLNLTKSYDAEKGILTLQAYVTGESVVKVVEKTKAIDITLVMDTTSSMDWDCNVATDISHLAYLCKDYAGRYKYHEGILKNRDVRWNSQAERWEYNGKDGWAEITTVSSSKYVYSKRIDALKGAATEFVRTIAELSPETRIGLVTFGSRSSEAIAVKPLTACDATGKAALEQAIAGISADNASTAQSTGMKKAMTLYDTASDRDKVMILFTDGEPVAESYDDGIEYANTVKKAGVTLYTIGIFDSETTEITHYMQYMSSKYPNATSTSKHGDPIDGTYYYSVTGSNNLSTILQTITETLTSKFIRYETLDKTTVLRDIISEEFKFGDGANDKVHIYTSNYIGPDTWDTPVEITDTADISVSYDAAAKKLDVSGFDYSENWCGTETFNTSVTYRGKKLIVTIPIKPVDGAIGATGINTNDPNSGIIPPAGEDVGNEPIGNFPVPTTDIPTNITITKVFEGFTPQNAQFTVDAAVSAHITGYEAPDEDNYTKSITEAKTYSGIVFDRENPTYTGINDILVATESRPSTVTVTEKSVPAGYKVTISDGTNSYDFTSDGGDISQTFSVVSNMAITVTNNKLYSDDATVTLKNDVSGSYGDKNMDFSFTGTYISRSTEQTISEALKHGESKEFETVDVGSTFIVSASNSDGYTTTVLVNGEPIDPIDGVYKVTIAADTVIEFRHSKEETVDVGLHMDCLPYVLALAAAAVGTVAMTIRKRKVSAI